MADGGSNAKDTGSRLYDPRTDANWQARLEEARAKRERVLSQRKPASRRKPRLKPWEEEGVVPFDDDGDFLPAQTGLEFSERVDAMRESAAPAKKEPDETQSELRGQAFSDALTSPEDDGVLRAHPGRRDLRLVSRPPVNHVAYDAYGADAADIGPMPTTQDYIPIDDIRTGPPEPVRPSRVPYVAPEIVPKKPEPAPRIENFREKKKSGVWPVAIFFLLAASVGPIYQLTRSYEWGPLVYTLSKFPTEPALGLTAPVFIIPVADHLAAWQPPSKAPGSTPLQVEKPSVPERTFKVRGLFGAPGVPELDVSLGAEFEVSEYRDLRGATSLPVVSGDRRFWPESTLAVMDFCCTAP